MAIFTQTSTPNVHLCTDRIPLVYGLWVILYLYRKITPNIEILLMTMILSVKMIPLSYHFWPWLCLWAYTSVSWNPWTSCFNTSAHAGTISSMPCAITTHSPSFSKSNLRTFSVGSKFSINYGQSFSKSNIHSGRPSKFPKFLLQI